MAYFFRLIVCVGLGWVTTSVLAEDYPITWGYGAHVPGNGGKAYNTANRVVYVSPDKACTQWGSPKVAVNPLVINNLRMYQCQFEGTTGTDRRVEQVQLCMYGGAPDYAAQVCRGASVCESGKVRNEVGACVVSPALECANQGGFWGVNQSGAGHYAVSNSCYPAAPSCAPPGERLGNVYSLDARCPEVTQGQCPEGYEDMQGVGTIAGSGGQCLFGGGVPPDPDPDPEPEPEPEPEPSGCASNQQSGTVNGHHVCINTPPPLPTTSTDAKLDVIVNADGSSTETSTEKSTVVDAETGTTTTTTTTTTVTKDAAGEVTGTEVVGSTTSQGKNGFCEENPNSELCGGGEEGSWAGGCDDPGTVVARCVGDPIQCAIAEQTLRTRCALLASSQVVQAFESMKSYAGTGPGEGLDVRDVEAGDLSVAMVGGGAGLSDLEVVVMGETLTVPFSKINPFLDIFGAAMLAVAWLSAATILRGAV